MAVRPHHSRQNQRSKRLSSRGHWPSRVRMWPCRRTTRGIKILAIGGLNKLEAEIAARIAGHLAARSSRHSWAHCQKKSGRGRSTDRRPGRIAGRRGARRLQSRRSRPCKPELKQQQKGRLMIDINKDAGPFEGEPGEPLQLQVPESINIAHTVFAAAWSDRRSHAARRSALSSGLRPAAIVPATAPRFTAIEIKGQP